MTTKSFWAPLMLVVFLITVSPAAPVRRPEAALEPRADAEVVRWVEPRLSIESSYRPCHRSPGLRRDYRCLGAAPVPWGAPQRLQPQDPHAKALRALLRGSSQSAVENAIDRLQVAVDRGTRSLELAVDLSAAHLLRYDLTRDPLDLLDAVEASDLAAAAAGHDARLVFNQALAASKMHLPFQAVALWRRYLELEGASGWALEARAHLHHFEELLRPPSPIELSLAERDGCERVRARIQELSAYGEMELAAWATALLAGDRPALDASLARADSLGQCLRALKKEWPLGDELLGLNGAGRAVAEGHRVFAEARRRLDRTDLPGALDAFETAERALAARPFGCWATFWRGAVQYLMSRYQPAYDAMSRLAEHPDAALRGRALGIRGLVWSRRGLHLEARGDFRAALQALTESGRKDHQAWSIALLAENHSMLGMHRDAQETRALGLQLLPLLDAERAMIILNEAAVAALDLERAASAELLTGEAEALLGTQESNRRSPLHPPMLAMLKAKALVLRGRVREALASLEAGKATSAAILDPEQRLRTAGLLALVEARGLVDLDPARALAVLEPIVAEWRSRGLDQELVELLVLEARAFDRLQRRRQAERSLEEALRIATRLRGSLTEAESHRTYARIVAEPFEQKIRWALADDDPRSATEQLEKMRMFAARSPSAGGAIERVQRRLRDDVAVLQAHRMGDALLLLCFDNRQVSWRHLPIAANAERHLDPSFFEQGGESARGHLAALWSLLIEPVEQCARATRLLFVIDPIWAGLPLSALIDPASKRYLIEDHVISLVPSLGALEEARFAMDEGMEPSILLASAAQNASAASLGLSHLPQAEIELSEIAAFYPQATILSNAEPGAVRAALPRRKIFHFAGHAKSWLREEAYLFFTPSADGSTSGVVAARDLRAWPLADLRLVYLSACSTLAAGAKRSDGLAPFADIFLGSGAEAIVGSTRQIPDKVAKRLAIEFHRRLRADVQPAAALREAQLAELAATTDLSWAALQMIGVDQEALTENFVP